MLCGTTTPLRSHAKESVHKDCAEIWNAAHPGEPRLVSDPPKAAGRPTTPDLYLQLEAPMSTTTRDVDHALAYPEPPASPLCHRHGGTTARPPTDAQKKRNRELLLIAQRSPRSTTTLTEAS